jgi:choline dehydrogenase-like flavoprotein
MKDGFTRREFISTTGGFALGAALAADAAGMLEAEASPRREFDFIVVGTGSGGGIMINRLVNAGFKVLALEAGVDMPTPTARRAEATQVTIDDEMTKDWPYHAESETTGYGFTVPLNDQSMGRMVGGSSHHYGMVCYRGAPEDFDEWDHHLRDGAGAGTGLVIFNGTPMVRGVGTSFTTELAPGDYIRLDSDDQPFRVRAISSDTQLVIDNPQGLFIPMDMDPWTKLTLWNRSSMLEHYKAVENDIDFGASSAIHSNAGFTEIGRIGAALEPGEFGDTRPGVETPRINPALIDAMRSLTGSTAHPELPFPYVDDINDWFLLARDTKNVHKMPLGYMGFNSLGEPVAGGRQTAGFVHLDMYDERRSTLIVAIDPVRAHRNFTLVANAVVNRILLEPSGGGLRTAGVEYLDTRGGGAVRRAFSPNVILAAGPFGTPAILLRSGVGAADRLLPHGIRQLHDLPGVGANLLQHVGSGVTYQTKVDLPLMFQGPYAGRLRTSQNRAGAGFEVGSPAQLFDDMPEITYFFSAGGTNELANGRIGVFDHGLAAKRAVRRLYKRFARVSAFNFKARSRGDGVRLRSTDPRDVPIIRQGLLQNPDAKDAEAILEAIQVAHSALMDPSQPFAREWLDPAFTPFVPTTVEQLHSVVGGAFHAVSTCAMGPASDPMAVCDERARVRGIQGLRICDNSIYPTHVRANPHLPTMANANLIADMILADGGA